MLRSTQVDAKCKYSVVLTLVVFSNVLIDQFQVNLDHFDDFIFVFTVIMPLHGLYEQCVR